MISPELVLQGQQISRYNTRSTYLCHLPLPLSIPRFLLFSALYSTARFPASPFTNFTSILYSYLHYLFSKRFLPVFRLLIPFIFIIILIYVHPLSFYFLRSLFLLFSVPPIPSPSSRFPSLCCFILYFLFHQFITLFSFLFSFLFILLYAHPDLHSCKFGFLNP